jgi:hypothetical protein
MLKGRIKIDLTNTKYKVIKECVEELGWDIYDENYKRLFDDMLTRKE